MQFTYLQDPGHGWVRCPLSLAQELGITPRVSRYSYFQPETNDIWLEEDCDAGLLLDALRAAGIEHTIKALHIDGDAAVRTFPRWVPATALLPEGSRHREDRPSDTFTSASEAALDEQAAMYDDIEE